MKMERYIFFLKKNAKTKKKKIQILFLFQKINSDVSVGTPEYISPEVLQAQEGFNLFFLYFKATTNKIKIKLNKTVE